MTIYKTLLGRGYFPKELPPAFFTQQFADYAGTKRGRTVLDAYKADQNFTRCSAHRLALPGHESRLLGIPHPATFAKLAKLTSRNFKDLLRRASHSPFSRSRPVYSDEHSRAVRGAIAPKNLARERAAARGGARFLVKADVSQFYPSLYTHAVGWAVNPSLRKREVYTKKKHLAGSRIDQVLMDLQGKVSQGIPIGNDISFLLGEVVLAQVDRALKLPRDRAFRWYDDYEIACSTRDEAETILRSIRENLDRFQLRTNPIKTRIVPLPAATVEDWKDALHSRGTGRLKSGADMVGYFDAAFRLRDEYPQAPVLLYALGMLFRLSRPEGHAAKVAQSGVSQCLLSEPGCAQKAFALLTFWVLNGMDLDRSLLQTTAAQIVVGHNAKGMGSDVLWALSFCDQHDLDIAPVAGRCLSRFEDDCIALQCLRLEARGLMPSSFRASSLTKTIATQDPDGEHWLAGYEAVRHGYVSSASSSFATNPLFKDLLACKVTFFREALPKYASVIHLGGAPEWVVRYWLGDKALREAPDGGDVRDAGRSDAEVLTAPVSNLVEEDVQRLKSRGEGGDDEQHLANRLFDLLDILDADEFADLLGDEEQYGWGEEGQG